MKRLKIGKKEEKIEESEEKKESKEQDIPDMSIEKFFGYLFEMRDYAHKIHFKTNSYAQHKALNEFYDELLDLADSLIESYQGCYGLVDIDFSLRTDDIDIIEYLKLSKECIVIKRDALFSLPALQNIVDEIIALLSQTLYKLTYLK